MTIRPLVYLPDSLLRKSSEPVKTVDKQLRALAADMFETMYAAPGIGLAAIQVGEPVRLITMDLSRKTDDVKKPMVFINPEITARSEELFSYEEGCLSIPDYYAPVERPKSVTVKYRDLEGNEHEIQAEGLLATCLQHEIDHLNGVLFIDHISKLKRMMVIKKFSKIARLKEAGVLE